MIVTFVCVIAFRV